MVQQILDELDLKEVSILGTTYTITVVNKGDEGYLEHLAEHDAMALCDHALQKIFLKRDEITDTLTLKASLRHEVIHAFLYQSGLDTESTSELPNGWARNEEMVDWFAIQWPKISSVYKQLSILD